MTPLLISELATNHAGDLDLLRRMVEAAAKAGADIVKCQAYNTRFLRPSDPQEAWLRRCELSPHDLRAFARWCYDANVLPLATVFDPGTPLGLREIGYKDVKVGSGDAMREDVIRECVMNFDTVYVSYGMAETPTVMHPAIVPLHCSTRYPTDNYHANLSRIRRLKSAGGVVGYSDHTIGIQACVFALALGASVIEKHFSLPGEGRNQAWDAGPVEFRYLANARDLWVQMRGGPEQDNERDPEAERFIGRWSHDGR